MLAPARVADADPVPAFDTVCRVLRGWLPASRWPVALQRHRSRVRAPTAALSPHGPSSRLPGARARGGHPLAASSPSAPPRAWPHAQEALRWMERAAVQEVSQGRHRAVVVVSHNACIQMLVAELLGLPNTAFRRLPCGFLHAAAMSGGSGPCGTARLRVRALNLAPPEWTAWLHRWSGGAGVGESQTLPLGRGRPLRRVALPAAGWAPPWGCAPRVRAWRAVLVVSGPGAGSETGADAALQALLGRAVGPRAGQALVEHVLHPTLSAGRPVELRALLALPASPFVHPLHRAGQQQRRRRFGRYSGGDVAGGAQGWLLCALGPVDGRWPSEWEREAGSGVLGPGRGRTGGEGGIPPMESPFASALAATIPPTRATVGEARALESRDLSWVRVTGTGRGGSGSGRGRSAP